MRVLILSLAVPLLVTAIPQGLPTLRPTSKPATPRCNYEDEDNGPFAIDCLQKAFLGEGCSMRGFWYPTEDNSSMYHSLTWAEVKSTMASYSGDACTGPMPSPQPTCSSLKKKGMCNEASGCQWKAMGKKGGKCLTSVVVTEKPSAAPGWVLKSGCDEDRCSDKAKTLTQEDADVCCDFFALDQKMKTAAIMSDKDAWDALDNESWAKKLAFVLSQSESAQPTPTPSSPSTPEPAESAMPTATPSSPPTPEPAGWTLKAGCVRTTCSDKAKTFSQEDADACCDFFALDQNVKNSAIDNNQAGWDAIRNESWARKLAFVLATMTTYPPTLKPSSYPDFPSSMPIALPVDTATPTVPPTPEPVRECKSFKKKASCNTASGCEWKAMGKKGGVCLIVAVVDTYSPSFTPTELPSFVPTATPVQGMEFDGNCTNSWTTFTNTTLGCLVVEKELCNGAYSSPTTGEWKDGVFEGGDAMKNFVGCKLSENDVCVFDWDCQLDRIAPAVTTAPTLLPTFVPTTQPTVPPTSSPSPSPTRPPTTAPPTPAPTTPEPKGTCAKITRGKTCKQNKACEWDTETTICLEKPAEAACADIKKRGDCRANKKCNWSGICMEAGAPAPEPVTKGCSGVKSSKACKKQKCFWNKFNKPNQCMEKGHSCTDLTASKACSKSKLKCKWNKKQKSCSS